MPRPFHSTFRLLMAVALFAAPTAAFGQIRGADRVLSGLDARAADYGKVAQQIWDFAEMGYQETHSSALLQAQLAAAGFRVEAGVAGEPTGFVATWGSGKPVIGIMGEFDALPGLSQDRVPVARPLLAGGPGHGCGHHLFGAAAAAAAISIREWLEANGGKGTIKFYGTPAEEGGGGKIYMVRAGLFEGVDAVITWHPGDVNQVTKATTLANISAKFRFHGVSAHAAAAPDKGRSALDGVEAMNSMVNLMREHVPAETRIHYIITAGGKAPNVVPDFAEVYYYARHSDMRILDGIWDRVVNTAEGAALGTGTTMDFELINAVYNVLPNDYLADVMERHLQRVGGVVYDADDKAFAVELQKSLGPNPPSLDLAAQVVAPEVGVSSGSTDVGDVSWVVPVVQMSSATWVPGTAAHSWQAVAAGGTAIGNKGMMVAAKTMALTGIELFTTPGHLVKAREEFNRRVGDFRYVPMIGDRAPPLDYRK